MPGAMPPSAPRFVARGRVAACGEVGEVGEVGRIASRGVAGSSAAGRAPAGGTMRLGETDSEAAAAAGWVEDGEVGAT